jgi:hypothetical protein
MKDEVRLVFWRSAGLGTNAHGRIEKVVRWSVILDLQNDIIARDETCGCQRLGENDRASSSQPFVSKGSSRLPLGSCTSQFIPSRLSRTRAVFPVQIVLHPTLLINSEIRPPRGQGGEHRCASRDSVGKVRGDDSIATGSRERLSAIRALGSACSTVHRKCTIRNLD